MRLAVLFLAVLSCAGQDLNSISRTATGNITAANSSCLAANCVWITPPTNANSVTVQLSGTFVGTVQFEATTTGSVYSAVAATNGDTSATATGTWSFPIYGYRAFRVRGSAYTSGTVVVSMGAASVTTAGTGGWTDDGSTISAATGRTVTMNGTVVRGGGTTLPATCTIGDQYFLTTGTTGLYQCTATDTWTLPGGEGNNPVSYATAFTPMGTEQPWQYWSALEGSGSTFTEDGGGGYRANTVTCASGTGISWGSTLGAGTVTMAGTQSCAAANYAYFNMAKTTVVSVSGSFRATGSPASPQCLFCVGKSYGGNAAGFQIFRNASGGFQSSQRLIVALNDASGHGIMLSYSTLSVNTTYNWVVTYDGTYTTSSFKVYINGSLASVDQTLHNDFSAADFTYVNAVPYIGSRQEGTDWGVVGSISNIAVWPRLLTATEASTLNTNGPLSKISNPYPIITGPITTSQIPGVVMSCLVMDGQAYTGKTATGGACPDNTAAIQRVLSVAAPWAPVDLTLEGGTAITGLQLPWWGHYTIRGKGWDTGFWIADGSNSTGLYNYSTFGQWNDPNGGTWPSGGTPARGKNVRLENFTINGNRSGNSTSGNPRWDAAGHWLFTLSLWDLDNVALKDLYIVNSPSFGMLLENVGYVTIDGIKIKAAGDLNTDGTHFTGPANNITISNSSFDTLGDDAIPLNAPEGYGGVIDGVTVTNCTFVNVYRFARVYSTWSTSRYKVRNISFAGLQGSASVGGFIFGNSGVQGTNGDWLESVEIVNTRVIGPYFLNSSEAVGEVKISNSTWIPTAANAGIQFDSGGNPATINLLSLNNYHIYRNESGAAAGWLLTVPATFHIGRAEIHGLAVVDAKDVDTASLASLLDVAGTMGMLWLGNLDCTTNLTAVLGASGNANITKIQGPAVGVYGCPAAK